MKTEGQNDQSCAITKTQIWTIAFHINNINNDTFSSRKLGQNLNQQARFSLSLNSLFFYFYFSRHLQAILLFLALFPVHIIHYSHLRTLESPVCLTTMNFHRDRQNSIIAATTMIIGKTSVYNDSIVFDAVFIFHFFSFSFLDLCLIIVIFGPNVPIINIENFILI